MAQPLELAAAECAALKDDLLYGMKAIADFFGLPTSKAYHLASNGLLPGVFKVGRCVVCSKSAAREAVRTKAKGGK